MNIQRVNIVLGRAILYLQESEVDGLLEFVVPSPEDMHRKHGMQLPAGMAKGELVGKGQAHRGMRLGDGWVVISASPSRVTVKLSGMKDMGYKTGKSLTYVWDGVGYTRQGDYIHADGIHKLAGSKAVDPSKIYPVGSVVQSLEKWTWVIVGKGEPYIRFGGEQDGYQYPVKKLKGKKITKMFITKRGHVDVDDGRSRISLSHVTVRPPQ